MGFWESVNSAKDAIQRNSPDLTPVKNGYWNAYVLGSKAVNAVKANGSQKVKECIPSTESVNAVIHNGTQKVKECIPSTESVNAVIYNGTQKVKECVSSPETHEKIGLYLTHPATREIVKFIPGASPAYNIAGAILKDKGIGAYSVLNDKKSEHLMEQIKMHQAENERLKAELKSKGLESPNTTHALEPMMAAQKPEDVIRVFMMKGCNVTNFLDNQVVPIRGKFTLNDQNDQKEDVLNR